MAEFTQNQIDFIQYELSLWAKGIEERLAAVLKKKGIEHTGALLRSLSYKVFQASGGNSGSVFLSFLDYGRWVDMGAGRASKIESGATNAAILSNAGKKRKPNKWYAKTVWPNLYGYLTERLMRGYEEQIVYALKNELTPN